MHARSASSQQASLQWHVYVAQAQQSPAPACRPFLLLCGDLLHRALPSASPAASTEDDIDFVSAAQTTAKTGIRSLLPHADIDDYLFEPCGYSMNGLEDDGVASTIHITPEDHCSYASLEISGPAQAGSMAVHADNPELAVRGAAGIFRPKHMAVAVSWTADARSSFADACSCPAGSFHAQLPCVAQVLFIFITS